MAEIWWPIRLNLADNGGKAFSMGSLTTMFYPFLYSVNEPIPCTTGQSKSLIVVRWSLGHWETTVQTYSHLWINLSFLYYFSMLTNLSNFIHNFKEWFFFSITGHRGRPSLAVTREQIELLFNQGFKVKAMARILGCSSSYLHKKMKYFRISMRNRFTDITDADLHDHVRRLHEQFPRSGSEVRILVFF